MKEQTLVETKNKVDALIPAIQKIIQQMENIKDLSVGTLEVLKNMPGYIEAVEKLKADVLIKPEEKSLELIE